MPNPPLVDWSRIETVLLDMDGTLLDLHFDTHFWTEYLPVRYAEKHRLTAAEAKRRLYPRFRDVEGTINWYCIDYWTRELGLDVALLKEEVKHLIAVHPYVIEFLDAIRASGRKAVLVTNAHTRSLELKLKQTPIGNHLDRIICSHDFGEPKETLGFWDWLGGQVEYAPDRSLLVDDSLPVLRTAREYGIGQTLAVVRPDTREPARDVQEFAAIESFRQIMP